MTGRRYLAKIERLELRRTLRPEIVPGARVLHPALARKSSAGASSSPVVRVSGAGAERPRSAQESLCWDCAVDPCGLPTACEDRSAGAGGGLKTDFQVAS